MPKIDLHFKDIDPHKKYKHLTDPFEDKLIIINSLKASDDVIVKLVEFMNETLKMPNQDARWKLYHMLNGLLRHEQSEIENLKHKRPQS